MPSLKDIPYLQGINDDKSRLRRRVPIAEMKALPYDQKPTRKVIKPVPDSHSRMYSHPMMAKAELYLHRELQKAGVRTIKRGIKRDIDPVSAQAEALIKNIKDIEKKIRKCSPKDEARKIKLESLRTRQLRLLQEANALKQQKDQRFIRKAENKAAEENLQLVRIGKRNDRLVPRVKREPKVNPRIETEFKGKEDKIKKKSSEGEVSGNNVWSREELDRLNEEFEKMMS